MRRPSSAVALGAGTVTLALVTACGAFAWPADSTLVPRRGGHPVGDDRWAWLYLVCASGAFVAYLAGLAAVARRAVRPALVCAVAAAIQLAPLGAPLLLSTDAWTYWAYGRLAAVHGENPYRVGPAAEPADAAFPYVGEDWRDSPTVYGPAFTLMSEPVALAAGASANAAAWTFKALAAACLVGTTLLAARLARRRALAAAFVGWNPLLALHFAGGGHNDAWVALLVVAALTLGAAGRRQAAGVAWAAGAFVKWIPLLFLPLRAMEARASGRRVGHLGFALAACAIAAAATARYGLGWLEAFGPLARNANEETRFALPHRLESLGVPHPGGIVVFGIGFAVGYVWLLRQARAGRARLALAASFLLLATPWLVPWYLAWAVPLAAVEEDLAARVLTLALCAYLLPQALPI